MKKFPVLSIIVFLGVSTAACGGDTTGLFGASGHMTSGTGGSGTGGSGQGGTPLVTSSASGSGSTTISSGSGTGGGAGQGGTGTMTASSSSGQGGAGQGGGGTVDPSGCSDGTREYFMDIAAQPNIAGCSGGFSVPGTITNESMQPACGRVSGNSSTNPNGTGCSIEDLCAEGWYVCHGAMDVQTHSSTGQCDPSFGATPQFFGTRQVQTTQGSCSQPPDANNVVGCGTLGEMITTMSCQPLNRRMKAQDCQTTQWWHCGTDPMGSYNEANMVTKDGPAEGGMLCCKF